jgi:putative tricarboxylic transport membrane protein
MLDHLVLGLTAALQFKHFVFMMLGTVIGLWVGVLPGLGGPVAMAILIPFTFSMDPLSALLMLASISVGAAFGGSVTSILLNIPGEASSAATAYDIPWRSRAAPRSPWACPPGRRWRRRSSASSS